MSDYSHIVKNVISSVPFDKVAALSKEQFGDVIAKAINEVLNSSEYIKDIYDEIAKENESVKLRSNGQSGF